MTTSTMNGNGAQRKQLSSQLDRLDEILDGLADALNESVADAVKGVIGEVVREAVETAVKEVLSSPELLRVVLNKHTPQMTPVPKRRTLKELLKSAGTFVSEKAKQAVGQVKKLGGVGQRCFSKVCQSVKQAYEGGKRIVSRCLNLGSTLKTIGRSLWQFRTTCTIALSVGVLSGVATYYASPVVASVASGLSGAAFAVSAMILLPLWRLITGNSGNG